MVLAGGANTVSSHCIVVAGAGSEDANGVYAPTGRKWHNADVFENDAKCLLSREPHKNNKTGETSYGWILGQDRKPLYAVQSSELTPPKGGWRKFSGKLPVPQFDGPCGYLDGVSTAVENFKDSGKALFAANKYSEAEKVWTRGLSLADKRDAGLKVAIFSNRSEVRLRLSKFDAALSDAQEALTLKPHHDKALLRAAVATREMKMYSEAYDFVQKCIQINPQHMEAKILLADLEYLIQDAAQTDKASVARLKMHESIKAQEEDQRGKKLGATDINIACGVKAFSGYADTREKLANAHDDRPPLSSMPYHHAGLPADQVKAMDKFFQEQRDKKDYERLKAKKEKENYAKIKEEFKSRAAEEVKEGRLAGLDEVFGKKPALAPSILAEAPRKAPSLTLNAAKAKTEPAQRVTLSAAEMAEIDNLFSGLPTKTSQPLVPTSTASARRKQLEIARSKML